MQDHDFELLLFMFKEEYIRSVIEQAVLYDDSGNVYFKDNIFHQLFLKNEKRSGRSYLIRGYFCRFKELLTDHTKYHVCRHLGKLSREEELVYHISMILEEFHGQISNAELEQRLNYNSEYINCIIKKRIGKTLSEYKREYLMKEACCLLLNKNKGLHIDQSSCVW